MASTVQSAGNAVEAREPQQERQQGHRYTPPPGKRCYTTEYLRPKDRQGNNNTANNNNNTNNDKPRGNRLGFLPENFRPREPTSYDLWLRKWEAEEREDRRRRKQEGKARADKKRRRQLDKITNGNI